MLFGHIVMLSGRLSDTVIYTCRCVLGSWCHFILRCRRLHTLDTCAVVHCATHCHTGYLICNASKEHLNVNCARASLMHSAHRSPFAGKQASFAFTRNVLYINRCCRRAHRPTLPCMCAVQQFPIWKLNLYTHRARDLSWCSCVAAWECAPDKLHWLYYCITYAVFELYIIW